MTPVSNNNDQQPKANLEELFRQKFAEAELTPRADVWDRLDHELLLRENQGYRRRLVGYRRLAAAACAVATLGAGGWLAQHVSGPSAGAEIAAVDSSAAARSAAARLGAAAAQTPLTEADRTASRNATGNGAAGSAAAARRAGTETVAAASATSPRPSTSGVDAVLHQLRDSFGASSAAGTDQPSASLTSRALAAIKQTFGSQSSTTATTAASGNLAPGSRLRAGAPDGAAGLASLAGTAAERAAVESGTAAPFAAEALQPLTSRLRRDARTDLPKVALLNVSALLAPASSDEEKEEQKKASISRWRWRGGYSAERFVPNMSSSTGSGVALRGIPATNSFLSARGVTAPEQTKLQPGLAQRVQFGAAVPLGRKHWTLLTGAELTSISGDTDREATKEFSNSLADARPQTGRYHLTTVGVPVQVRYEGRKQGWGVYAAVGAAVNVLLRNRTAVGTMTTTGDASYRSVLASARGSAGVRFSPAGGQWQLNVGPEAEAGLTTLNANPGETWSQRTRPYAVGLSASVEFGGGKAELAP
ncbi:PorT family protein [Hymenobacter gummosus]|uniref:PorT family protein n=1 Tax=Hymenobacter gummosus TaxID=1776032 RepID=A0A431U800_9BACT|nr:outer membrane beta-barrel protein [Hymenobacter gummosus]RTQ53321.1 PorT family protein [Hymenobacter gummosus]